MISDYIKKEILELVSLIVYITLVIGSFSLFFLFGGGGIEKSEILTKNNFYIPYGIIFLFGIVSLKIAGMFIFGKSNASQEGSIIHDPEQSPIGRFLIIKNPFLLAFFSIILFSLIAWFFTNQQTFFVQSINYEQQFTLGADLFFSVYPASPSETLGALFLISLYGFILSLLVLKNKLPKYLFIILFIIGSIIISAIFGIINHYARYGFDEVAIQNVAVFWSFGGLITAITCSVIPFLILHDVNNFFFKLAKLFSSDIITFITFTIIGILFLGFLLIYLRIRKKRINNIKI